MKTYKHLYPRITSFENLHWAFLQARRGKRARNDVAAFEYDLEENLLALQDELDGETYRPGPYFNFRIFDPKPRLISAAPFRDRVVHHALCQVIEPIWERRFIHDTYACRVGKGTHAAIHRAQDFSRRFPYVLKCDIEHFFPRMDHEILYSRFARLIADPQTLRLCKLILDSGAGIHTEISPAIFPGDDLFSAARLHGLPIGNLTSQFWANVYLDPLDQFVKRELKCPAYCRYVDDVLLFSEDKVDLHRWRAAIIEFLASLRLTLHEAEAQVFPVSTGIPFLGWRIYPDHLRLKRQNGVAFQRRFSLLLREYAEGKIPLQRVDASVQGWIAHVQHGQTWGLRRSLLGRTLLPPFPVFGNGGRPGGGS
jgi:RNA-directed DNA polymerase